MIRTSIVFFGLALGSLLLGITETGGVPFGVGRFLLFVFLGLAVVAFARQIATDFQLERHSRRKQERRPT